MATKDLNAKKARFDTRLSKEQKALFERAARLGGYSSLTDFVVHTVQEKAKIIVQENERLFASEKDSELFFDTITNPGKPNKELTDAANEYKVLSSNEPNN